MHFLFRCYIFIFFVHCVSCNTLCGHLYLYKTVITVRLLPYCVVKHCRLHWRYVILLLTYITVLLTHGDVVFLCNLLIHICMYVLSSAVKVPFQHSIQQHDQDVAPLLGYGKGDWGENGRQGDVGWKGERRVRTERETGRCWMERGKRRVEKLTNEVTG